MSKKAAIHCTHIYKPIFRTEYLYIVLCFGTAETFSSDNVAQIAKFTWTHILTDIASSRGFNKTWHNRLLVEQSELQIPHTWCALSNSYLTEHRFRALLLYCLEKNINWSTTSLGLSLMTTYRRKFTRYIYPEKYFYHTVYFFHSNSLILF